eukprot:43484-Pyramimonas_sp.AAC.1
MPRARCASEHGTEWAATSEDMEVTSSADGKWKVFVYQAEWNIADALGLAREFEVDSGRACRPRFTTAKVTAPSQPWLLRVSA